LKISSAEDSSSEYASACETLSVASTNVSLTKRPGVRKKKRNATGFPAPPKRKSKIVSKGLPSKQQNPISSTTSRLKPNASKNDVFSKRTPRDRAAKSARPGSKLAKIGDEEDEDESPSEDSGSETQDVFQPKRGQKFARKRVNK